MKEVEIRKDTPLNRPRLEAEKSDGRHLLNTELRLILLEFLILVSSCYSYLVSNTGGILSLV